MSVVFVLAIAACLLMCGISLAVLVFRRAKIVWRERTYESLRKAYLLFDFNVWVFVIPIVYITVLWLTGMSIARRPIDKNSAVLLSLDVILGTITALCVYSAFYDRRHKSIWIAALLLVCTVLTISDVASADADGYKSPDVPTSVTGERGIVPGQLLGGPPIDNMNPGACVTLGVDNTAPSAELADCSTGGYRIIQTGKVRSECVNDVDQIAVIDSGALCLDYNWSVKTGCLRILGTVAYSSDCRSRDERFRYVVLGVRDTGHCESGGFEHAYRRFSVCTQTIP